MFTRPFHPDRFLQSVYGTSPFLAYCRTRQIPFEQTDVPFHGDTQQQWTAALAEVPQEQHAQVELELAMVNEMAEREALASMIEAAIGRVPPAPVCIPDGAPLALWFLVSYPVFFHEVFLHHEINEVDSWQTAEAPKGLALGDLQERASALEKALAAFFRLRVGTGQFCSMEAHQLADAVCFIACIADRFRFLDIFTENGRKAKQKLRPAIPVLFVYYPSDGLVLLKSHLRSRDRTAELLAAFGKAVLGAPISCDDGMFDLDLLKQPFHPLPDAQDMELVRVKALHLRYPEHARRRQLKLETLVNDRPDAIDRLLETHVGATLPELRVSHAELQVRLRGLRGSKNYRIRLWANHCNLSQTPLGNRFFLCLKRWGLHHGH